MTAVTRDELPGLNCGLCGFRNCDALASRLVEDASLIERCLPRATGYMEAGQGVAAPVPTGSSLTVVPGGPPDVALCGGCPAGPPVAAQVSLSRRAEPSEPTWQDTLGRDFDFYLEHFPEDPGPREIILPHNPLLTRELDVQVGDVLIGRPLGMSCGCPITHCGVTMQVDHRTGVIVWCVTGPLRPRQEGYKDLGYYIAEGYEGLIAHSRCEINIGRRYFFQPRMCMLQWRHSGLVNFINRTATGISVRVEGLWIG